MAAKKSTLKPKYYAYVDRYLKDVDSNANPIFAASFSTKEEIAGAEEDPTFVEITKRQYDRLQDSLLGRVYVPVKEEVEERTNSVGDWIFNILIFGAGFVIGAILL